MRKAVEESLNVLLDEFEYEQLFIRSFLIIILRQTSGGVRALLFVVWGSGEGQRDGRDVAGE